MAYNTDNLDLIVSGGPSRKQVWLHTSGADAVATVRAAGYISDAKAKGMRVGDVVINVDTSTPLVSLSRVSVVASTGATLTA